MTATAAAAAAAVDPERLLWVPGQRTYFLPPEKPLIAGDAALAEFTALKQQFGEDLHSAAAFKAVYEDRIVATPVGNVTLTHDWAPLAVNGHPISARDAARLMVNNYGFHHEGRSDFDEAHVAAKEIWILERRQAHAVRSGNA